METRQAAVPGGLFSGQNYWYEQRGGNDIIAYAGASKQDPSQGIVWIVVYSSTPGIPGGAQPHSNASAPYPTPVKAGPVRVVSAIGEVLTLASDSGQTFTFDVASRTFVSGQTH